MYLILMTLAAGVALWAAPAKKIEPAEFKAAAPGSRRVVVDDVSVVPIYMRAGYQTLFMLPAGEKVLDVFCGNKGYVVIDGAPNVNFVLVKPVKDGFQTNLNIMTVKGNVYSFLITAGTSAEPDLKIFVDPKEGTSLFAASHSEPLYVPKEEVAKSQVRENEALAAANVARETADIRVAEAEKTARLMIDKARGDLPGSIKHAYGYTNHKTFNVKAIYHDDKFMYIEAKPTETPVLYALVDQKPAIVQFAYKDGLYTVQRILDRGYLAIGKERLHFTRQER